MSKELTEQWRNGTLEESMYYVKLPEEIIIANIYQLKQLDLVNDADEIEVLAPVPGYDEYKRLQEQLAIATKALEFYTLEDAYVSCYGNPVNPNPMEARKAIKEMEGK